jgi:hypothetical protein
MLMLPRQKSVAPVRAIVGLALCVCLYGLFTGPDRWYERTGQTHNVARSARLSRATVAQLKLSGPVFLPSPLALAAGVIIPIPITTRVFEQASFQRLLPPISLGCLSDRAPPVS